MEVTRTPPALPAMLAKGALRRLAQAQLEPTPENYARAYAEEGGQAVAAQHDARAQGIAWVALVDRLVRNLDRVGRQWTAARRKESLRRVLDGSRSDPQRLLQRLQSLITAWESDQPAGAALTGAEDLPAESTNVLQGPVQEGPNEGPLAQPAALADAWPPLVDALQLTVCEGLTHAEHADGQAAAEPVAEQAAALAAELARLANAVAREGASAALVSEVARVCEQARRLFVHRHRLVDSLAVLCRELSAGLVDLAEDDSWAKGQCAGVQERLAEGLSVRGVHAASVMLAETRQHQLRMRQDRSAARDALKQLISDMLREVGDLGEQTGRFQLATERHAQAIEQADSLESLAGVVKHLLADSRSVQAAVSRSQERLQADQQRAHELESRVRELEGELRRLSDEVCTDALTQVANRRGLAQAFEAECARSQRETGAASALAVGLIDIDNFKKLNDTLGHAAGDLALKSLAAAVRDRLRPVDHLARFGGEEFVLLLPATAIDEAQQAMTRLQRSLSASLFMHEGRDVFVTFSGGVTAWRPGESLSATLERADEALYEAKRSGKNRTCIA